MNVIRVPIFITSAIYNISSTTFTGILSGVAVVNAGNAQINVDNSYFSKCGFGPESESGVFYFDKSKSSVEVARSSFYDCYSHNAAIHRGNVQLIYWNESVISTTEFTQSGSDTLFLSNLFHNNFRELNASNIITKSSVFESMLAINIRYSVFAYVDTPTYSEILHIEHTAIIISKPINNLISKELVSNNCYFPQYYRKNHDKNLIRNTTFYEDIENHENDTIIPEEYVLEEIECNPSRDKFLEYKGARSDPIVAFLVDEISIHDCIFHNLVSFSLFAPIVFMHSEVKSASIYSCTFTDCLKFINSGAVYINDNIKNISLSWLCVDNSRGKSTVMLTKTGKSVLELNETNAFNIPPESSNNIINIMDDKLSFNYNNFSGEINFPISIVVDNIKASYCILQNSNFETAIQVLFSTDPKLEKLERFIFKNFSCTDVNYLAGITVYECYYSNLQFKHFQSFIAFFPKAQYHNCYIDTNLNESIAGINYTNIQKIEFISEITYFCFNKQNNHLLIPVWGIALLAVSCAIILIAIGIFVYKRILMQEAIKAQLLLQRNIIDDFG